MPIESKRMHDPLAFHGRVEMLQHNSLALAGNPLGDPARRELAVYVPPGCTDTSKLPVLFLLAGFTGRGQAFVHGSPWFPSLIQRYDELVAGEQAPGVLLAMPDAFSRMGGSQYLNSSAQGNYRDYLIQELLPLVDAVYGTAPECRGVFGKSSGGFGALTLAMREPGQFQAVGAISADCGFENTFGAEFLQCLRGLQPFGMNPARFLDTFRTHPDLSGDGHAVINVLAMAACYSPNAESELGFDLPFELQTGERIGAVWQRWLSFDPMLAVDRYHTALTQLKLLHIECGTRDEFHLQWGNRRLDQRLTALGVPHCYEEHPGGHRGIDERYLKLIPKPAQALRNDQAP